MSNSTMIQSTQKNVSEMSYEEKLGEAISRSIPKVPSEIGEQIKAMMSAETFAIILIVLVALIVSHAFGVGAFIDVIILVGGVALLGWSFIQAAQDLYDFATIAINAQNEGDLDRAADYFARAVAVLGVAVISTVLLRVSSKYALSRRKPKAKPMAYVGPPPRKGHPQHIRRKYMAGKGPGYTDAYGNIFINRRFSIPVQRRSLYHELVHRWLSPRIQPLRSLRASMSATAKENITMLRYIEEAWAECYALIKDKKFDHIITGIKYPLLDPFYKVTIDKLITEGVVIGNIIVSGTIFTISIRKEGNN